MNNFKILFILVCLIIGTESYGANNPINVIVNALSGQIVQQNQQIPSQWLTFIPRKLPFVPFDKTDYFKIYSTPLNISKYAKKDRQYNKNYKPYYPEKYLYETDYTYETFLKDTNLKGKKEDNAKKYNEWLWNKIRSDFKNVHGMYTKNIVDSLGNPQVLTWEDGGIISIYEQRKLYYEYAIIPDNKWSNYYKFIQNFRFPYSNVRVNNPRIIFLKPEDDYFHNALNIKYEKYGKYVYEPYSNRYQIYIGDGVENSKPTIEYFIGPDAKIYYMKGYGNGVFPDDYYVTHTNDWRQTPVKTRWTEYIRNMREQAYYQNIAKPKKLNVFLYYEIYDAFCRKYGYAYKQSSYQTTIPMKATIKYSNNNYNYSEYQNFYNRYKDYITGAKSPSYEYLDAKQRLEERNIKLEITPEKKETHVFTYLSVNASSKTKNNEVYKVYAQKKDKVRPQPYSVQKTVNYYKKLRKEDVKMILEHLQKRLNIYDISDDGITNKDKTIMSDNELSELYYKFKDNPEGFRQFAPELDKKYSKYYPQNMK